MDLEVYSRRWGHTDRYTISRNRNGWFVGHIMINGNCDKRGKPFIFENLKHDSIKYPEALGDAMEQLWNQADSTQMSDEEIQSKLDSIGHWISETEKSAPIEDF